MAKTIKPSPERRAKGRGGARAAERNGAFTLDAPDAPAALDAEAGAALGGDTDADPPAADPPPARVRSAPPARATPATPARGKAITAARAVSKARALERTERRMYDADDGAANALNESLDALHGLAGGIIESLAPQFIRDLSHELRARIAAAPLELNGYGYDPWGLNVDVLRRTLLVFALFYKYYFRVKTHGIENLPRGRMLVIANHAGQIAIDACMINTATVLEADPPRPLRGMGEYWLPTVPFVNVLMARGGGVVGTPKNAVDILEHGEAVIAFPEGVRGMNKPFTQRYVLQEFGNGFMRLALQTGTPIVPVAVVGSEEQAPSLGSFAPLAKLLGMPAFPIVLTPFPFPTRYHLYFGEPMEFRGNPNDEDEVIVKKVNQVKARIDAMIQKGLRERRSVFF